LREQLLFGDLAGQRYPGFNLYNYGFALQLNESSIAIIFREQIGKTEENIYSQEP